MTTVTSGSGWRGRARELVATLAADGVITDAAWREAFEQTPRHVFAPRFWALDEYNAPTRLVDGADPAQRDEWLDTVYSDRFLATQWALQDGHRMVTSSASQPSLVARMLHLLDLRDGQRVLEIGTGTGYNTALLCRRVGGHAVASVDLDPVLVAEAGERLTQIGCQPQVTAADGADGLAQGGPYDRILSTCASPGVPRRLDRPARRRRQDRRPVHRRRRSRGTGQDRPRRGHRPPRQRAGLVHAPAP